MPSAIDASALTSLNDIDKVSRDRVRALVDVLCVPMQSARPGACSTAESVVPHLLPIEDINFSLNDRSALEEDMLIELVQISVECSSPLSCMQRARDKLLGLQLARFAAFYKNSWRAYDRLHGGLDGSERLVKILLSPQHRLRHAAGKRSRLRRQAIIEFRLRPI